MAMKDGVLRLYKNTRPIVRCCHVFLDTFLGVYEAVNGILGARDFSMSFNFHLIPYVVIITLYKCLTACKYCTHDKSVT